MKKLTTMLTVLFVLLMVGCGSNNPTSTEDRGFSLSMESLLPSTAKNLLARVATDPTVDTVDFEMGLLKGSMSYPFALINNSDGQLTGITITSSNPKFITVPQAIASLGVPNTDIGSSTLVQVVARHGVSESGTGVQIPVITEEDDTTTITISGIYKDTTFEITYTLRVDPAYVTVYGNTSTGIIDSIIGTNCSISYWDTDSLKIITSSSITRDIDMMYTECVFDTYNGIPASSVKAETELKPINN